MAMMSGADQRLTPDAVQTISFRSARLGRRGFDEEHVRAFCRQVEAELVVLHSERSLLQEEVGRLRRRILGVTTPLRRGGGSGSAVGILSRLSRRPSTTWPRPRVQP